MPSQLSSVGGPLTTVRTHALLQQQLAGRLVGGAWLTERRGARGAQSQDGVRAANRCPPHPHYAESGARAVNAPTDNAAASYHGSLPTLRLGHITAALLSSPLRTCFIQF